MENHHSSSSLLLRPPKFLFPLLSSSSSRRLKGRLKLSRPPKSPRLLSSLFRSYLGLPRKSSSSRSSRFLNSFLPSPPRKSPRSRSYRLRSNGRSERRSFHSASRWLFLSWYSLSFSKASCLRRWYSLCSFSLLELLFQVSSSTLTNEPSSRTGLNLRSSGFWEENLLALSPSSWGKARPSLRSRR